MRWHSIFSPCNSQWLSIYASFSQSPRLTPTSSASATRPSTSPKMSFSGCAGQTSATMLPRKPLPPSRPSPTHTDLLGALRGGILTATTFTIHWRLRTFEIHSSCTFVPFVVCEIKRLLCYARGSDRCVVCTGATQADSAAHKQNPHQPLPRPHCPNQQLSRDSRYKCR